MSGTKTASLKKDEDFLFLIQPLDAAAGVELEEDLFDNGCRNPIETWRGFIVDGNRRYDVCTGYEIPYETVELNLPDKLAVMDYICTEQLKRGDLTDEYFKYLIGKRLSLRMAMGAAQNEGMDSFAVRIQANRNRGTMQKYAEETGFAIPTVRKYREFSEGIDTIRKKQKELASLILESKLKVSHESVVEISRLPKEEVQYLHDVIRKENRHRLRYGDIQDELRWKYSSSYSRGTRKKEKQPEIRRMPKYDPDAEVSSLALTIPSWISSIHRAAQRTNFDKITPEASERLKEQIDLLGEAASKVRRYLKEG